MAEDKGYTIRLKEEIIKRKELELENELYKQQLKTIKCMLEQMLEIMDKTIYQE